MMKVGEKAKAENFEQVSMMHCDIQEYADLAAESTALQMVDLINDITDFYDSIIRKYDAYKIDTFRDNTLVGVCFFFVVVFLQKQMFCRSCRVFRNGTVSSMQGKSPESD